MIFKAQRITIIKLNRPKDSGINLNLQWFGNSLGLFNLRDKNKSCFRIFIELLKNARHSMGMTSDELALKLDLTRGTVVHHINKLSETGIIVHEGNKYYLRVNNLKFLIEELEKDVTQTLSDLKSVASELDDSLGL